MWYLDSGATSHITATPENIQLPRSFTDNNFIYTADGSPIQITRSSRNMTQSKDQSFILQDLLLVPSTTRNLLSVNRFCIDNNVSLHFDSQKVKVHDTTTEEVLLEGRTNGGWLYELPLKIGKTETVNICEKLPHHLCYSRLRHLNSSYMSTLIKNGVINSNIKTFDLCNSCQVGKSHTLPHLTRKSSYMPLALIFGDQPMSTQLKVTCIILIL